MDELAAVGAAFGDLMLTVLPWFALGTLTAAAMETFVPTVWAQRVLTGRSGLPAAVTAGAVLPGCSCTTMPLAAGLSGMAGPRVGTLTAFVFVSPLLSPITVLLTLSLLGWEMTAARVLAALGGSLAIGLIINRHESRFRPQRQRLPVAGGSPDDDRCCAAARRPTDGELTPSRWGELAQNARRILRAVLPYFLAGMRPTGTRASRCQSRRSRSYGGDGVEDPPTGERFQVFPAGADLSESKLGHLNAQTQEGLAAGRRSPRPRRQVPVRRTRQGESSGDTQADRRVATRLAP